MPDILSLNQLIAERVREHPDLQILAIPDKNLNYTKYTTAELDAAASLLANHLKGAGVLSGRAEGDATSRLTVGLLSVSNIDYVVTEMTFKLYRMGYCVLFLPNNSPPAIAHLLTATNASHIIVQDTLISSATAALAHLTDPSSVSIIHQPPSCVFGPEARTAHPDKTHWHPPLSPDAEFLLPITVVHSSGSTGYPKPIILTNKAAVGNCKMNFGLTSLTTLSLYHICLGHGHSNLLRAWYAAKPLYLFPTSSIPLTSANIIKLLSQAPGGERLSINAVFEHPSITKLANLIVLLSSGKDADALQTSPQALMLELVDKYSHFTYPPPEHHVSGKLLHRSLTARMVKPSSHRRPQLVVDREFHESESC